MREFLRKKRLTLKIAVCLLTAVLASGFIGCAKKEKEEEAPAEGLYSDFLIIETKPLVQDNGVLDVHTLFTLDWERAMDSLGIVEREAADLWVGFVITKLELADVDGTVVQDFDFERDSYVALLNAAAEHDTDPQIFNRIIYSKTGFTDNYATPSIRPNKMTAAVHFPVYEELGHTKGVLNIYGFVHVPKHYEEKPGAEGIYVLADPKQFDEGLVRSLNVDATGFPPVPVYSKRIGKAPVKITEEEYKETVTVIPSGLRLRDAPSLDAKVVKILDKGTKLEVLEESGDWLKVRAPEGEVGWARARYEGEIYLD